MKISFVIEGNQENPNGNPMPKVKMTGKQQWLPRAQKYARWKQYVQSAFYAQNIIIGGPVFVSDKKRDVKQMVHNAGRYLKPIDTVKTARMDIIIYWADERHADPESIFGSVADALFVNDKELDGSFQAIHNPERKGRVEVTIIIAS